MLSARRSFPRYRSLFLGAAHLKVANWLSGNSRGYRSLFLGAAHLKVVIVLKNNPCSPVLKNVGCQKDFIQLFSVLFICSISEIYITIHITVYGTVLYIK